MVHLPLREYYSLVVVVCQVQIKPEYWSTPKPPPHILVGFQIVLQLQCPEFDLSLQRDFLQCIPFSGTAKVKDHPV